jgi:CxxC motif-containing protein
MARHLICIECPKGCALEVETSEDGRVRGISGNQCAKGDGYARQEVENPLRTLTTTVLAQGLVLKRVPVRTSKPIPKARLLEAAAICRKLRLTAPLQVHDVIVENFLGLGVNLIATRSAPAA